MLVPTVHIEALTKYAVVLYLLSPIDHLVSAGSRPLFFGRIPL